MVATKICAVSVIYYVLRISVSATHNGIFDLSYTNHLTPTIISRRLQNFITNQVSSSPLIDKNLIIDISNANLGDFLGLDYLQTTSLLSPYLNSTSAYDNYNLHNSTAPIGLDLILHSNRLTSQHVTTFLNEICDTNQSQSNISATTPSIFWRSLDFGWNLLYDRNSANSKSQIKRFHAALQNVLISRNSTIEDLHLSCCGLGPATCRALAKGLLNRFDTIDSTTNNESSSIIHRPPVSLYLSNNRDIGDSGAAAIAAAIRCISISRDTPILHTLDLSGCDIGDIGVEALALAFEDAVAPVMIRRLLLCHNRITDQGALAMGRVLHRNVDGSEFHIDLSNNPSITDRGITNLLSAVEKRCISSLILRSCSIHADGAELVGKTLRSIALSSHSNDRTVEIDLSGNPLGILRGKTDKGNIYSAGAIKSKASATATAYVTQGLSFLKKGLGSVGVTLSPESEDEDDEKQQTSDNVDESDKGKNMRCGFKSLANAFISYEQDTHTEDTEVRSVKTVLLGLRRTFCDTAGADALAAIIMATREQYQGLSLKLELELNPVVEDEMVNALYGQDDEMLQEMADRHNEAMEILRLAQERAVTATKALAARRRQTVTSSSPYDGYDNYDFDTADDAYEDHDDEPENDDGPWETEDEYGEGEGDYDDTEEY
jgi:Leucine Rich repeat